MEEVVTMKKTAMVLLALCIFFSGTCTLAEDNLHKFLDIPFGIGMEECNEILEKKTESLFPEGTSNHLIMRERTIRLGSLIDNDTFLFYGYPASASFHFSSKDKSLEQVVVVFDLVSEMIPERSEDRSVFFREHIENLVSAQVVLDSVFGAFDTGVLSVGNVITSHGSDIKNYRYPIENGILNEDILFEALSQNEYGFLITNHGNAEVKCTDMTYNSFLRATSFTITYKASKPSDLELVTRKAVMMAFPSYPMP